MMVNNEIGVQQPIKEIGMSIDLFIESIEIYFKENYVDQKKSSFIRMQHKLLERFLLMLMK